MPNASVPGADGKFNAYVAKPNHSNGAGLVVIQEIFGVNKVMRDLCDHYAEQGFVAVCPDLFWRIEPNVQLTDQSEDDWAQAFKLMEAFMPDFDKGLEDLQTTLVYIRQMSECENRIGCVGYCLGGSLAYSMACQSDVDASVGYYPVQIEDSLDRAQNITKPAMFHVAELDGFCPPESQDKITRAFASNKNITHHLYTGVDHAFARNGGTNYNAVAAALADDRTAEFFKMHLL